MSSVKRKTAKMRFAESFLAGRRKSIDDTRDRRSPEISTESPDTPYFQVFKTTCATALRHKEVQKSAVLLGKGQSRSGSDPVNHERGP